jgi:hypothetical protein
MILNHLLVDMVDDHHCLLAVVLLALRGFHQSRMQRCFYLKPSAYTWQHEITKSRGYHSRVTIMMRYHLYKDMVKYHCCPPAVVLLDLRGLPVPRVHNVVQYPMPWHYDI